MFQSYYESLVLIKWWKYKRLDKWHENYVIENNDGNVEWLGNCVEFDVSNGYLRIGMRMGWCWVQL